MPFSAPNATIKVDIAECEANTFPGVAFGSFGNPRLKCLMKVRGVAETFEGPMPSMVF